MPARNRGSKNRSDRPIPGSANLDEEIATLRESFRQIAEKIFMEEDPIRQARILAVLSQTTAHLANVLKLQNELGGGSRLIEEVRRVADIVRQKLEQPEPE